jgi:cytochrome c556
MKNIKKCANCGLPVEDNNNDLCNSCGEAAEETWTEQERFKAMLKDLGMDYFKVAEVTGHTPESVKVMLKPSKELPRWCKLVLCVYENKVKKSEK